MKFCKISELKIYIEIVIHQEEFFCKDQNDNKPIVAGFLYLTNSNIAWLEWIISDPNYKEINKRQAIELLITSAERAARNQGKEVIFSVSRNKALLKMHKKLGYTVDKDPSYEIIKNIKN